jgi:membrane-bound ClpP family serine protease
LDQSLSDPAARAELERYFDRIEQHLPNWLARFLHWLRQPSMLVVRVLVCVLLIAGGILSFLPILGFWMLPLGLMIIAQDLPFIQPPLVRIFQWTERKWENWQRGSSR